jgi:hypothetical protein
MGVNAVKYAVEGYFGLLKRFYEVESVFDGAG